MSKDKVLNKDGSVTVTTNITITQSKESLLLNKAYIESAINSLQAQLAEINEMLGMK